MAFIPPTEFAEDSLHTSGDLGVMALSVQKATPADIAGEGDYTPQQTSGGRVWTSTKVDTALPAGTNVIGHVINDTGSTTAVTGNVTVVQPTGTNLHTVIDSGVITTVGAVTSITNALPTGTNSIGDIRSITTSVTPGTSASNLGKAEDSIHASGDTGVMALGVSNVAQTTLNADGDYSVMATDLKGNLYANLRDTLGNATSAFPAAFLRTTDEPHQIFYDAFDTTTLDTITNWNTSVFNGAQMASNSVGVMNMGSGTTANGFSILQSKSSFKLPIPAWLGVSDAIALPDGASPTSNSYRYWGTGTVPTTPTTTTPVTDGYGFELGTDGKLRAVVYAGGTRTVVQDLSTSGNSTQPLDASYHRYIIYIRTDKAYWYIDGVTSAQLVATSNFQSSQVQTLPRLFLAGGAATPPVSNTQIQCTGATVWDTGKNSFQMSDGTTPSIKATIKASTMPALSTDTSQVVALSPNSPLPTGNNRIGTVKVDDDSLATTNDLLNQMLSFFPNMVRRLDNSGRELFAPPSDTFTWNTTITASTAETTILPTMGAKTVLVGLVIANTSASTFTEITIRDSTGATDATSLQTFTSLGGAPHSGFMPGSQRIPQKVANNNWTAQCGTSTTSIKITVYYQIA